MQPHIELQQRLEKDLGDLLSDSRSVNNVQASIGIEKKEDELSKQEVDTLRDIASDLNWNFKGFEWDYNKQQTFAVFER